MEISLNPVCCGRELVRETHAAHRHLKGSLPRDEAFLLRSHAICMQKWCQFQPVQGPHGADSLQLLSFSDYLLVEVHFPFLLQLPPLVHIKVLNTQSWWRKLAFCLIFRDVLKYLQ